MRNRIYQIIETDNDQLSKVYDLIMMAVIIISIVPLMFKHSNRYFEIIDLVSVIIFISDYILRLLIADLKLKKGKSSFIRYPFTFMAIVDLISILPSITVISQGFRLFKIFRLVRSFKVFRVFRAFRYSKNITLILNVLKKQKDSLMIVGVLAIGYILVTALIIFNIEPDTFPSFFDAIYWATISLTTVGYGDIYATSTVGKVITMISSLFGIAVVALPAGIITAGYMEEIEKRKQSNL